MNEQKLIQNLIDLLYEQQVKLKDTCAVTRYYYPLSSLNRLLDAALDTDGMQAALEAIFSARTDALQGTEVSHTGERFCLALSGKAALWAKENAAGDGFLPELIETLRAPKTDMDAVLALFLRYRGAVIEQKTDADFDVLAYFSDGVPDSYRYCLTDEGCHIVYHRFTPEDYNDFYPATDPGLPQGGA